MNREISGVYRITCLKNNKHYIGISKNIPTRWTQHAKMLREGNHHSSKLQEDYNLYGEECFEFRIIEAADYSKAKELEEKYIKEYRADIDGYNCMSLNENIHTREEGIKLKILDYIKESYKSDGNVYCYDLVKFATNIGKSITDFLKWLNINYSKTMLPHRYLDKDIVIGVNYTNVNVFVTVFQGKLFSDDSDYIEIDTEI